MNGTSAIQILGVPEAFASALLVFTLILCLAPYFAGADFGILKIPDLRASMRERLRSVGPLLFALILALFVPVFDQSGAQASLGASQSTNSLERDTSAEADSVAIKMIMAACSSEVRPRVYKEPDVGQLTDEEIIKRLVKDEGDAAEAEDVVWHASLFHPRALFHDKLSRRQVYSCEEIAKRDIELFSRIRFHEIDDEFVKLSIEGNQASAITRHRERVFRTPKNMKRPLPGGAINEIHAYIEWKFTKEEGVWRIYTFLPAPGV